MTNRGIAVMLIALLGALSACTSSSTTSVQSGAGNQYDSQYRGNTTSTRNTYDTKPAETKDGDAAITIMQLALETGDVYPGEDHYVHAVVDNPTDRKNIEYVWAASTGELTEVPESERGRLQALVEEKYAAVGKTEAPAGEPAPIPQTGSLPAGATTEQPSEGAAAPTESPLGGTPASPTSTTQTPTQANPTQAIPQGNPGAALTEDEVRARAEAERLRIEREEADRQRAAQEKGASSGAVKTEDNRMTRSTGAYERRIVAGPEDDAYFSEDDQAEIGVDTEGLSDEEKAALQELADENRETIEQRADSKEVREDQTGDELRSGQRRLISDDQRDEPEGSPNVVEGGTGSIEGDPYETGDRRDRGWGERPTARELDRERGLIGGGEDLTADLDDAERAGAALRRGSADDEDRPKEITAEDAYKRFTLVTDEPFVRWTPTRPGDAKLFVKVRFKTDDLTKPTELPVEVRLQEPRVEIADEEFPDMVREDEPLFIRIDGDNLPAFHKGLFTLSFDPDMLSFREAELGEFFDEASGADLLYMQPDKLAGKVIFAIDSNTELSELTGGGPLLYVKFKAKRDIETRDETQLALVQDTSSQYVLDGAGDNILPMAVEHPVYATKLVMPANGAGGHERTLTPGEETPGMRERAAEEAAAAARAGTAPGPNQPAPATGPQPTPNPNLTDPNQPPAPIDPNDPRLGTGQPLEGVAPTR